MFKILFISSDPYPFGMAGSKRIRLFAEQLGNHHSVKAIVTLPKNGNNENYGTFNMIPFELIKFTIFQLSISFLRIYNLLKKEYDPSKKNIIFLYNGIGLSNYSILIIGKFLKYKILTDIVEDYSVTQENESIKRKLLLKLNSYFDKVLTKYADGIIVISTTLYQKYISQAIPQNKIAIIPVSAENLLTNYEKEIKTSTNIIFLYSGTYGQRDGVEFMIESFKLVQKEYPNIILQLAGKINNSIRLLITNERNIEYLGLIPNDQYYQYLINVDVLLMTRINSPYANAGFPFKLGEYLATGNPVIATDVSDVNLYLTNRTDAYLIKPQDFESLKASIIHIIEHPDESAKIGLNGKESAIKYFNPIINGKILESLIHKVC
jgi:glycosyltransferase involved in cell wall biosynthesis